MAKSGNPAKAAEQLQISKVGDFKKRLGGIFELPSGMVVKLRNPGGMNAFIQNGTIPNSLMTIMQSAVKGGTADVSEVVPDINNINPELIADMTKLMDNISIACIVEPKVHPAFVPTEEEPEPDDEILYVNELTDDDKSFVFQWLSGGTASLETFREQQRQGMADMAPKSGTKPATKRAPRIAAG